MILGRWAQDAAAIERTLHLGCSDQGHWIYDDKFLTIAGARRLNFAAGREGLDELRAALSEPSWVVINVFGPLWVSRLPGGTASPHGPLCAPDVGKKPYHAVVLVAWQDEAFLVLDPYFEGSNQPFEVSDDELLATLMGFAVVVADR